MFFKKTITAIAALALLACVSVAIAQDAEKNDGAARVVFITAKDGEGKALEKAIVEYHHFMATKPGSMRYQWFAIQTGEHTGQYVARTGDHNWADFDVKHDWDDEAAAKFASLVQPHVAKTAIMYTRNNTDYGIWPESLEGYEYFSVTRWYIQPGQSDAFYEGLKKVDATLKSGGFPRYYAFINTVSGGHGNMITLVSPRKNFADMAPREPSFMDVMKKAMGDDEARAFVADWGSTYKAGENYLLHRMAEQSDYGDGK